MVNEMTLDQFLSEDEVKVMDGFNDCIIGIATQGGHRVAIYDEEKIIESLVENGMDYHEATEYYSFNIECAYVGQDTPIIQDIKILK
jgi:hypothetical protein